MTRMTTQEETDLQASQKESMRLVTLESVSAALLVLVMMESGKGLLQEGKFSFKKKNLTYMAL